MGAKKAVVNNAMNQPSPQTQEPEVSFAFLKALPWAKFWLGLVLCQSPCYFIISFEEANLRIYSKQGQTLLIVTLGVLMFHWPKQDGKPSPKSVGMGNILCIPGKGKLVERCGAILYAITPGEIQPLQLLWFP